jgi:hypothetical protein
VVGSARLFGDNVSWIAARHSSSPVCTPTAIDIIEISVADGAAERGHELACGRGALLLLEWHGRRLLAGVP